MYNPQETGKPHIVVLTGAGISAESGLKTFRDSDGLWMGYNVYEVASPAGWKKDPALVLDFYNKRRRDVAAALCLGCARRGAVALQLQSKWAGDGRERGPALEQRLVGARFRW